MAELFVPLFFSCIVVVSSYPVENPEQSLEYLSRFGYLSPGVKEAVELRESNARAKVREGLKNFQYFAGIPRTGVLDQITIDHMNLPRCGNSELEKGTKQRRRRFVLDSKWEKIFLTYRIVNLPSVGPTRKLVEDTVRKAFAFWSEAANIHVQPTKSPAEKPDIEISFVRGKHNDGIQFDVIEGVGRVVAHAWKPFNADPLRGDMHFNDEVTWGIGGSEEVTRGDLSYDFLRTAIHEAGHALGLEHSPHPEAMMYFAVTGQNELRLSRDDKQGIQELYGPKLGNSATLDPNLTWKKNDAFSASVTVGRRPIVVPSGTPIQNVPWECYRFQEQNPKDAKGIRSCYQQFYRDYYLSLG